MSYELIYVHYRREGKDNELKKKNCDKAQLKRFFFIGTENILILDLSEF